MATKNEFIAQEVARAVGAGKAVALETVDFSDPNRPKTCLEIDFPILPVNQIAVIEGNAGKPIYQMSKWWARRRSSVFRSMLIAAATKAPEDPSHAAKLVWENYYANHQKKGAFKNLKVADIFMGGGTTLVEGTRLGMQMSGNDLNPVAWFLVKQELANIDLNEVKHLLTDIEVEVKPQIMPFYYCDGPSGEKGVWTHKQTRHAMGADFDPLTLTPEERRNYSYDGPEVIYTFWAKHGPCQVTGCGHRTPIMASPIMSVKTMSVKHWEHKCAVCLTAFHVEEAAARMAPDVPLYVAPGEYPYSILDSKGCVTCPHCGNAAIVKLGKGKNKKIKMTLLVHPEWLKGSPKCDPDGQPFGGASIDDAKSTARWNRERSDHARLLEVRGIVPDQVTCPETGLIFSSDMSGGNVPQQGHFVCQSCGTMKGQLSSFHATGKTGPVAAYAIQGYAPKLAAGSAPYNGRFFAPFSNRFAMQYNASLAEWESRRDDDLAGFWPKDVKIPRGHEAHQRRPLDQHGYFDWTDMFNPRQLLVHSLILRSICRLGHYSQSTREFALGLFQQFLRNENMFCFWDHGYDKLVPFMSNSNFHPKTNMVENCVFQRLGRGNWSSCSEGGVEAKEWCIDPWELVNLYTLSRSHPDVAKECIGKSAKAFTKDQVLTATTFRGSSTDLGVYQEQSLDLIITDPPFGDLIQYSELADFFYVWLRLPLKEAYPEIFTPQYTPKTLEAVANRFREPEDPNGFYQRLLTECWREGHRALKPGGILAFTFHHSEDEPWVAVLESLFDAGFYLEATYPIRSDETKGEGQFGSKKVEYDIIHVCRKRTEESKPVSWGRMRREVLADVRQLQGMLENHARAGLPAADLQVVRRGKALEYFSRHYGKVYVDEGRTISVRDALVGINQLIDEDTNKASDPPPATAEPITRQFLRMFQGKAELARDQVQKLLRGSGIAPDEFTNRGWANEQKKVFYLVDPFSFARDWQGRHKRRLIVDLDQALVLIGACYDGSGINAVDTLKNENFKPHAALKGLLDWFSKHGPSQPMRNASSRALSVYNSWADHNREAVKQLDFFLAA